MAQSRSIQMAASVNCVQLSENEKTPVEKNCKAGKRKLQGVVAFDKINSPTNGSKKQNFPG